MNLLRFKASRVYTPYFNQWNQDVYERRVPFDEDPLEVMAGSTSGASVAITDTHLIGLAKPVSGARFIWDGKDFAAEAPEQNLIVIEGTGSTAWEAYHRALDLPSPPRPPFGRVPEYCTWVEQVWSAEREGRRPNEVLSGAFVRDYLNAVCGYGWPKGRFTIDEGWCPRHGTGGFGDWTPAEQVDLPGLAANIVEAGFVPGLWFAPALVSLESRLARNKPELLGEPFSAEAESGWSGFVFLRPSDATRDYLAGIFRRAWNWGFRKFKIDIFYGPKRLMIELHRLCWEAAQLLPGPVELEGHVPDPFAAQFVHVVRLNDVLITPEHPAWRRVAESHFQVCRESAPGHLLNLDHLGGNRPSVTETQWIEHAGMMRGQLARGYPTLSLLPGHVSANAATAANRLLRNSPRG